MISSFKKGVKTANNITNGCEFRDPDLRKPPRSTERQLGDAAEVLIIFNGSIAYEFDVQSGLQERPKCIAQGQKFLVRLFAEAFELGNSNVYIFERANNPDVHTAGASGGGCGYHLV